jgi:error-prone DNA polymerase
MGFYAPAQLVGDAREHGVEVRPVDIAVSAWESTLEGEPAARVSSAPSEASSRGEGGTLRQPVRLGLNRVKGLAEDAGKRIVVARAEARFADSEDLARRARLGSPRGAGEAGALQSPQAIATGVGGRRVGTRRPRCWRDAVGREPVSSRRGEGQHRRLPRPRPTLNRHPLAVAPAARRFPDARVALRTYPNGRLARASGLVTHRQRPETANERSSSPSRTRPVRSTSSSGRRSPRRSGRRCSGRRCSPSTANGSARARASGR